VRGEVHDAWLGAIRPPARPTVQIDQYRAEARVLHGADDVIAAVQSAIDVAGGELQARCLAVIPHAQIVEPERTQRLLGQLDLREPLLRDLGAVRNA